jgi:hypothetical protein
MSKAATLANIPSYSFMRNRIINGAMEIAQRATTATGAYTSVYVYASVDRWPVYSPNSSTTQAQSTDAPTGFRNSFRIQRPASNTGTGPLLLAQAIESVNCYDLSGQTATLSFWAKRGANYSGGALGVSAVTGTVADQGIASVGAWTGRQTPISTSFAITTTWTRYTVTGTFGSGVLEAAVEFSWSGSGTAGADDSVYISGVQLEAGSITTPFERRQFGQELQLCQRYYEQYGPGYRVNLGTTANMGSTQTVGALKWLVPKRVAPTVGIAGSWRTLGGNQGFSVTLSIGEIVSEGSNITGTVGSGYTQGQANFIQSDDTATGVVRVSAEL